MDRSKLPYTVYSVAGALYVLVKVAFIAAGFLHLGAIAHGAIPATITVATGVLAARASNTESRSRLLHRLMVVWPIAVFFTTPVWMYLVAGRGKWLTEGRLQVLVLYEAIAVLQLVVALVAAKRSSETDATFPDRARSETA